MLQGRRLLVRRRSLALIAKARSADKRTRLTLQASEVRSREPARAEPRADYSCGREPMQ